MKKIILLVVFAIVNCTLHAQINENVIKNKYSEIADKIYKRAMQDSASWERMAYICDMFGSRLSGSKGLENALLYIASEMNKEGFDRVVVDPVKVPHWERGFESLKITSPITKNLAVGTISYSVNTPKEGIKAEAIVVKDFKELKEKADKIKGKIVVYNEKFKNYGQAVQYRWNGASEAARYGAVASLFRSVTSMAKYQVHYGSMGYNDSLPKIPNAAITPEDADLLERLQKRGEKITLDLKLENFEHPDANSSNVFCEIKGSELPNEIIVMGGHSDCWGNSPGAHDDSGPTIVVWQALKIIKELNLKPKRTIRAVWWVNEENGLRGGKAYAEKYGKEKHILALENDAGVFEPKGFRYNGSDSIRNMIEIVCQGIEQFKEFKVGKGGGGADISPLTKNGLPALSLDMKNDNYFWYHHSPMDTPDKLNPDYMNKSAAAIALMIYILSDLL